MKQEAVNAESISYKTLSSDNEQVSIMEYKINVDSVRNTQTGTVGHQIDSKILSVKSFQNMNGKVMREGPPIMSKRGVNMDNLERD